MHHLTDVLLAHCCFRTLRRIALGLALALSLMQLLLAPASARAADAEPLRIAVAANFRPAAEQLGKMFTADSGVPVLISSASTGILAAQMRRGAPFDLLLAADKARPLALIDDGTSPGPAFCYARGSLVLLGAKSLETALADPGKSIAIANPRSAPYGAAALEVLQREGFAATDARRVVMGSNVQQALQFFQSGAADLALVARSLSPTSGLPVPADWHAPIQQYAVISAGSSRPDIARSFIGYLMRPAARAIMSDLGYQTCS